MTLMGRLIFGTAHLYGGPYLAQSQALLRAVREAGVTRFDTAPLYGMGTAEGVLGQTFAHDPAVKITTKAGLARPPLAGARVWARYGLQLVRGRRTTQQVPAFAIDQPTISGSFGLDFIRQSYAESCLRLRRQPTMLMLHECHAPPSADLVQWLESLRESGELAGLGYANGTTWSPALDAAMPAGWTAQAAASPADLVQAPERSSRPIVLHGLIGLGAALRANDPSYAAGLARIAERFATIAPADEWPALLPYCLAASVRPQAHFIFATAHETRASAFLHAIQAIDAAQALADIAGEYRG